jgi:hypothetical protein
MIRMHTEPAWGRWQGVGLTTNGAMVNVTVPNTNKVQLVQWLGQ